MPSINDTPTPITPPRVPLIDSRTGLIDRSWYMFFLSLMNAATLAYDGDVEPNSESLLASYDAALQALAQNVDTQPLSQVAEIQKQLESLNLLPIPLAVTSVAVSGGTTGLTTFGGPITTFGTITLDGTLLASNGGTGQFSYSIGDILYASSITSVNNVLAKLPDVATGNALISGGVNVAPLYGKIGLTTHVSGVLPTANGGTDLASFTANGVVYASSTSALATGTGLTFDGTNFATTGTVTMSAYGAGTATFSAAGVISSVSDETWKTKDGVPVDTDSMLRKLQPGYWYYNEEKRETFGKERQLGFYAQNVNAAIGPEAAPKPKEGKPWGYYDRSVLAVVVMSLQKALDTIDLLTSRIAALE
jgi:hypothetical protein